MTAMNDQRGPSWVPEIPLALTTVGLDQALRDAESGLLPASRRAYRTDALQFAQWLLEHELLPQKLTHSDMRAYRNFLQERHLANASANRKLSVARLAPTTGVERQIAY